MPFVSYVNWCDQITDFEVRDSKDVTVESQSDIVEAIKNAFQVNLDIIVQQQNDGSDWLDIEETQNLDASASLRFFERPGILLSNQNCFYHSMSSATSSLQIQSLMVVWYQNIYLYT